MDASITIVNSDDEGDGRASAVATSLQTVPSRRFLLTRRGRIFQSTTERYLRDDLGYGTMLVPSSSSSSSSSSLGSRKGGSGENIAGKIVQLAPRTIEDVMALRGILASTTVGGGGGGGGTTTIPPRLVVVDTNVLLHHMDVLEHLRDDDDVDDGSGGVAMGGRVRHRAIANAIVIPQTALEECRHRSLVMYRRATDLVRSGGGGGGGSERRGGGGNRRPVIVFADAHHVDTQVRTPPSSSSPASAAVDDDDDDDSFEGATNDAVTTINDENDARLRNVAMFYGTSLASSSSSRDGDDGGGDDDREEGRTVEVVFLSDDAASRSSALLEQRGGGYYVARSVREHVSMLQGEDPTLNLLDMVAQFGNNVVAPSPPPGFGGGEGGGGTTTTTTTTTPHYEPHVSSSDLSRGLRTNRYHQGVYHTDRYSYSCGYVTLRSGEERVAVVVRGATDVNRAVDGDIVAVELFAVERWLSSAEEDYGGGGGGGAGDGTTTTDERAAVAGGEDPSSGGGRTGIAADTAEPSVRDTENIAEEVPVDDGDGGSTTLRRPAGRVVGIIRRNFANRNYCGSICTVDDAAASKEGEGGDDDDDDDDDDDAGGRLAVHPHDAIAARHEREHPDGITSTVVFFSIDQRVPPVLLRTTQRERLVGMRILVSMDSWPADSEFPLGHYVQTLGAAGTKDTETQVLLQEFRIPCEPFPAKVGWLFFRALLLRPLERESSFLLPFFFLPRLIFVLFYVWGCIIRSLPAFRRRTTKSSSNLAEPTCAISPSFPSTRPDVVISTTLYTAPNSLMVIGRLAFTSPMSLITSRRGRRSIWRRRTDPPRLTW